MDASIGGTSSVQYHNIAEQTIASLSPPPVIYQRQQRHCFGNVSPGEFPLSANPSTVLHVLTGCNLIAQDLAKLEDTKNAANIHQLFGEQIRPLRHATLKELITLRMRDGDSVLEHGVKLIGLVEKLVGMNLVLPAELTTDVLLLSLPSSFDPFVVNFNMNKMEPTLEQLVNMLVTFESLIKKEKSVLYVDSSSGVKKRHAGKRKKRYVRAPEKNVPLKRQTPNQVATATPTKVDKTDAVCYHCNKPGHWRRNCREYLAQKRSGRVDDKKQEAKRG